MPPRTRIWSALALPRFSAVKLSGADVDVELAHVRTIRRREADRRIGRAAFQSDGLQREAAELEHRFGAAELEVEVERDGARQHETQLAALSARTGRDARVGAARLESEHRAALLGVVAVQRHGAQLVVAQMHAVQQGRVGARGRPRDRRRTAP